MAENMQGPSVPPAGGKKKDTTRIDLAQALAEAGALPPTEAGMVDEAGKKRTARIDLTATGGSGMLSAEAEVPSTPGTIRLKKPGSAPTIVLKRPGAMSTETVSAEAPKKRETTRVELPPGAVTAAVEESGMAAPSGTPRTIRIKKPATTRSLEEDMPIGVETVADLKEAKKGETSRIDVPESAIQTAPSTQRKTIRIKRPGGDSGIATAAPGAASSAKTLTLAHKPGEGGAAAPASMAEPLMQTVDAPGAIWLWFTILSFLVTGFLIYVLSAEVGTLDLLLPTNVAFIQV